MTATSMPEVPRTLPDRRTAFNVDRLLMTARTALMKLPKEQQREPISPVTFLARHARRLHGLDLTAADSTLRAALERLGNPHSVVSAGSLARRIDLI